MQSLIPRTFSDVVPSDTVPIGPTIGLYIGGEGTVVAKGENGVQGTFIVSSGQYLSGSFTYVMAASTATGIVALRV